MTRALATSRAWLIGALAAAIGALALFVVRPWDDVHDIVLRPDDARVVAQGARVYAAHCASCHGARLEGQPNWRERGADGRLPAPPHDASGHTWHHSDALLFDITKRGVAAAANLPGYASAMPAFGGVLSDADIMAALSWIKAQWPPEQRAWQDGVNRQAVGTTR